MRQIITATMLVLGGLVYLGSDSARAEECKQCRIGVTFTNRTDVKVVFRLNGGRGLVTCLSPGESRSFSMAVDKGTPPAISIRQRRGKPLTFSVGNDGRYVFGVEDGKIVNCYE